MMYNTAKPAPAVSAYDHEGEPGDNSVVRKIVSEHGPASHSVYSHGGGAHNVISHHADGHVHISTGHPSFEHASEHLAAAHQK